MSDFKKLSAYVDVPCEWASAIAPRNDKIDQLQAENAKLRELCETFGMIANGAVCDYYDRDELLAQANVDACELGVEL